MVTAALDWKNPFISSGKLQNDGAEESRIQYKNKMTEEDRSLGKIIHLG